MKRKGKDLCACVSVLCNQVSKNTMNEDGLCEISSRGIVCAYYSLYTSEQIQSHVKPSADRSA